jgi:hypothetical protein
MRYAPGRACSSSTRHTSGAVLSRADLDALAGLLRGSQALVLADEVYEHMLFDGRRHHSLLSHSELAERSFVVSSFGKTYHATGWKVGYCVAPAPLTAEFRKVHQFVQPAVATPLQPRRTSWRSARSIHRPSRSTSASATTSRVAGADAPALTAPERTSTGLFRGQHRPSRVRLLADHRLGGRDSDLRILRESPAGADRAILLRQARVDPRCVRIAAEATMNSNLRVTMIQSALAWQEPATNRRQLAAHFRGLAGHTDLIVLPEMFPTGFSMAAETLAETMDGPTVGWMREEAAALGCVITGSLIVKSDGRHYNRLVWARPDGTLEYYDKRHLFRMAEEQQHFAAGERRLTVELKGWRVCPLVCYDLRFPVWSRNRGDYDLLVYVANWPARRARSGRPLLRGAGDREPELRRGRQSRRNGRQWRSCAGTASCSTSSKSRRARAATGRNHRARPERHSAYRAISAHLDADDFELNRLARDMRKKTRVTHLPEVPCRRTTGCSWRRSTSPSSSRSTTWATQKHWAGERAGFYHSRLEPDAAPARAGPGRIAGAGRLPA